jgi:DNA end-binding protein Ku
MWKGFLRFMVVSFPIRIYNAIEGSETVRFNQLHRGCNGRVGYEKRCKRCHEILEAKDIVKGYENQPDQYVIVEDSDLQKVKLKSTKMIEIEGFIDAGEVPTTWYEAPYYIGPDGLVAVKTFNLLREALRKAGRVGVGRVVLHDREDVVLISPQDDGIVLYKLRDPRAIRKIAHVPQLDSQDAVKERELNVTLQVIEQMATDISEIDMTDHYQSALRDLITAKIEGQELVAVQEEEQPTGDIMDLLMQSLEKARKTRKPMAKAGEAAATTKGKEKVVEQEKPKARRRKQA